MSLLLIPNPPTTFGSNDDWITFLTRENAGNIGHGLSIPIFTLTNWDGTTTIPAIAEGSIIEVGGSLYQADADTALVPEGGISDGTVHIKLVPQAGTPPASVVPTLTNDAIPAFDANKGGWYDSDDKFLPFEMTKASAVYTVKSEYIDQNKTIKISPEGFETLEVNGELTSSEITTDSIDFGAGQIISKIVSGSTAGTNTATIAHGLTNTDIRGLACSTLGIRAITNFRVEGANIVVTLNSTATQTVYVTIFYVP